MRSVAQYEPGDDQQGDDQGDDESDDEDDDDDLHDHGSRILRVIVPAPRGADGGASFTRAAWYRAYWSAS